MATRSSAHAPSWPDALPAAHGYPGSHRHFSHPVKPGLVTVAGKPSATLKPKTELSILKRAGLRTERQ
ncbi:MAG TPA: type II toxin-antitoxin system HicA family toxin [Streptosporangiaceae bacterium]|nr:type II toxin-antitoxin system HicA family toxin [Streptosporangiaceae bacterium]